MPATPERKPQHPTPRDSALNELLETVSYDCEPENPLEHPVEPDPDEPHEAE